MDRRALLISIIATAAGVALLRFYLQRVEQDALGGPTQPVLVLIGDLPAGTALARDQLATRELPQAYLESRHVLARQLNEVIGLRLALPVRAREALLWTDLASLRPAPRTLARLVPAGMRALSLNTRAGALDALLVPGDRVDVLLARDGAAATTVAEDLLVLAVGGSLGGGQESRGRSGDVTLSASPEQSRRLVAAEQGGPLRVVLRHPDDVSVGATAARGSQHDDSPSAEPDEEP